MNGPKKSVALVKNVLRKRLKTLTKHAATGRTYLYFVKNFGALARLRRQHRMVFKLFVRLDRQNTSAVEFINAWLGALPQQQAQAAISQATMVTKRTAKYPANIQLVGFALLAVHAFRNKDIGALMTHLKMAGRAVAEGAVAETGAANALRDLTAVIPRLVDTQALILSNDYLTGAAARRRAGTKLAVLIEGAMPAPEAVRRLITELYPALVSASVAVTTHHREMQRNEFAAQAFGPGILAECPDLLEAYAPTGSPDLKDMVGASYMIAEQVGESVIKQLRGLPRDHFVYFHESLFLAMEDRYYTYLRTLKALDLFLDSDFDEVLVIGSTGTYVPAMLSMATKYLGKKSVQVSVLGATAETLRGCIGSIIKASEETREKAPREYHLGEFHPPQPYFDKRFGPLRPASPAGQLPVFTARALINRHTAMQTAAEGLRDAYARMDPTEVLPPLLEDAVKEYGDPTANPDEPWLCLVISLGERVYGDLYKALLRHYLPRRKVLVIDHTARNCALSEEEEQALFGDALCCRVVNFLTIAAPNRVPQELVENRLNKRTDPIHAGAWAEVDLMIGQDAFIDVMRGADNIVKRRVIDHHLRVAASSLLVLQAHKVDAIAAFPTRNTHMRMAIQAARLLDVPSLEAQTLLGGTMVRHRPPNTDTCILLESWSRKYYADYLGYPDERISVLGSLRFDTMLASLEGEEARAEIAGLPERLFPDAPHGFPLVMFGTQPLEVARNRYCLSRLIEACASIPECRIVVKMHPAEIPSMADRYANVAAVADFSDRVVVTADINTMRLMAASDLVVAQFSNILLEAAFIDRRACSLHFSSAPAPIDFVGMGVAAEVRSPKEIEAVIGALVTTPPGEHPLDASRQAYVAANPQLAKPGYLARLCAFIDSLPEHLPKESPESLKSVVLRYPEYNALARRHSLPRTREGTVRVTSLSGARSALVGQGGASAQIFLRVICALPEAVAEAITQQIDGILQSEQDPPLDLILIAAYFALANNDVRAVTKLAIAGASALEQDPFAHKRLVQHLQMFNLYRPHALTEVRAQIEGRVMLAAPTNEPDVRHILVLTEGDIDSDVAQRYVDSAFPNAEKVTISFLSRHNGIVERFQEELRSTPDRHYAFIDLLADYTGNYMPTINSAVGASYLLGDLVMDRTLPTQAEPTRAMLGALREAISQGLEDHYYRYLRTLKSVSLLLEFNPADALLIIAATGTNLTSVVAIAERTFSRSTIHVALPSRNLGHLTHVRGQLETAVSEDPVPPEDLVPSRLDDFHPPPPFCSFVTGPVRPALDPVTALPSTEPDAYMQRYTDTAESVETVRAYFEAMKPATLEKHLASIEVKTYGRRTSTDAPWVMLALNFDDRVHTTLYEDLVAHYRDTARLLILDFSKVDGDAFAGVVKRQFEGALHVDVYQYRSILKSLKLPPELTPPDFDAGVQDLHPTIHRDLGVDINLIDLTRILDQADKRVFQSLLPSNMQLAFTVMGLLRLRRVTKAVVCPTRSALMRVIAQSARVMKVPTLEAQTVLNGRMVRHRAPNTDYCSVLETWSSDYYARFFGYPQERLLLGGALRYDTIVDGVETDAARAAIAGLRETLFPGAGDAPLVMFGTQPMQISDNLFCLERLLDACKGVPGTRVVVKVHPAEGDANRRAYQRVCLEHYPVEHFLVTTEVDTYHLMKAADLTVSQTSNILLESGFLDCRAISLHFGAYHPPVDFEEMNTAMIIKDVEQLPQIIHDLLTAPPGQHWFDARRRRFIEENPQLVDRMYRKRIVGFLDALDGWRDQYDVMVEQDKARLEAFDPTAFGWRL